MNKNPVIILQALLNGETINLFNETICLIDNKLMVLMINETTKKSKWVTSYVDINKFIDKCLNLTDNEIQQITDKLIATEMETYNGC